jgi:hypothetical protein
MSNLMKKQYCKAVLAALLCVLFLPVEFCFCQTGSSDKSITLDKTKQLFLDDYLIESMTNVTRELHPAVKHPANPIVRPTEPWENNCVLLFGSVLRDGDKYRMWYYVDSGIAYAESNDGLNWRKIIHNFIEKDGQKTNVLVKRYNAEMNIKSLEEYEAGVPNAIPLFREFHGVHKDNLETDPSRRYKMTYSVEDFRTTSSRRGIGVAFSEDGINWKFVKNWVTESSNDISHLMFDAERGKWVLYGRTVYHSPEVLAAWGNDEYFKKKNAGRAVTRLESKDLVEWDYTEWKKSPIVMAVDTKDPPGSEIYSMQVFKYESVYIGLVQMFYNRKNDTLLDVQLAVSRDGVKFERVGNRKVFIPCGGIGQWDRFNTAIADNDPLEMGDELWFYYSGRTYRHGPYEATDSGDRNRPCGAIGIASIKRDRFVSLGASFDAGTIITRPVALTGTNLHLNAQADYGSVLVEILDKDKKVIATSKPLSKDSLDIAVEWETGSLHGIDGPVSLRITLRNALLFAVWCE